MEAIMHQINEGNHICYFDYLRVIASAGVMLTHVVASYLAKYNQIYVLGSSFAEVAPFFDALSRFAVPLFMMITGTLIFDNNYKFHLKKSVLKIALPLLTWSLIYIVWVRLSSPNNISLTAAGKFLFVRHLDYNIHLWYLYALIGIYLTVPCIKKVLNPPIRRNFNIC
jgi:surface polysaccharide O-acyltransferase-like enzyme